MDGPMFEKRKRISKRNLLLFYFLLQDNHGQIWNYYVKVIKQEKCKCLWDLEKRYRVYYGKNKRTHRLYTIVYSVYSTLLVLNKMMLILFNATKLLNCRVFYWRQRANLKAVAYLHYWNSEHLGPLFSIHRICLSLFGYLQRHKINLVKI